MPVKPALVWLAILAVVGLAPAEEHEGAPAAEDLPDDGLYLVLRAGPDFESIEPLERGETAVERLDGGYDSRVVVIRGKPDVPFRLAAEPKVVRTAFGSTALELLLEPVLAEALRKLTTNHVGEKVAIVVDGVLVSAPVVRAPIPGGLVQITFLTEEDCLAAAEYLRAAVAPGGRRGRN